MNTTLESILGANWRTTLFGSLTVIAAYIAANPEMLDFLGDAKAIKFISGLSALITGIVTAYHMKDKQVSGNGTEASPHTVTNADGTGLRAIAPLIAAFLIPIFLFQGCAAFQTNLANVLSSPVTQEIASAAGQAAAASIVNSLNGSSTGANAAQTQAEQVALAALFNGTSSALLSSAAAALRTQQTASKSAPAATPAAITSAVIGAGAPSLAPQIAASVAAVQASGIPANVANEAIATSLDTVAANVK